MHILFAAWAALSTIACVMMIRAVVLQRRQLKTQLEAILSLNIQRDALYGNLRDQQRKDIFVPRSTSETDANAPADATSRYARMA